MEETKSKILKEIDSLIKLMDDEKIDKNIQHLKSQINYQKTEFQPDSIKNIIKYFNNIYEKMLSNFKKFLDDKFKSDIINKHFEMIKHILEELRTYVDKINIVYESPNKIIFSNEETQKKFDTYYKKTIKEYRKFNMFLINKINYLFEIFKTLFSTMRTLTTSIKDNINAYEQIGNRLSNKQDDDLIIKEGILEIYNYYAKIVESFNKIELFFEKVKIEEKNLERQTPLKKLENLIDRINDEKKKFKNINEDIDNYYPTIEINIGQIKDIYNNIINILKQFQNFKIKLDLVGENEMRFDILFILDTTNSMGKYLKIIKDKLKFITEEIKKKCPLSIIYIGFIGYKDFSDLELGDEYIDIDFTLNIDEVYNQIKDIEVDGGDDIPEDVAGAFELALEKHWGAGSKLAFLITDSPCHGTSYHDLDQKNKNYIDKYPNESYDKTNEKYFKRRKMDELVREFASKEISLVCFDILKITKKMYNIFEKIYKEKNKSEIFYIEKIEKDKLDIIIINKAIDEYNKNEEIIKKIFAMEISK